MTHLMGAQQDGKTVGERLAEDLRWTQAEREERFGHMDQWFPVNRVKAAAHARTLRHGHPLRLTLPLPAGPSNDSLRTWMERDHLQGVLVLQHGSIRIERYGPSANPDTRWTGFSMTKSVTSTLVGAAILDGSIRNVDDQVTRYLPAMRGSAYDGVTVRELLTMTSGVRWVEDYSAPDSDNVKLYATAAQPGRETVVEYMRQLPRESPPGTKWVYKTGETDLTGALVRASTHRSLSEYLSEKVWRPAGMGSDASWIVEEGREYGGSGLSATLRDWGRFGQFVLEAHAGRGLGRADATWFQHATRTQEEIGNARGYGYQWWTFADGSFAALGIFGQSMLIDPARDTVVVVVGATPAAASDALAEHRATLWAAVRTALDAEPPNASPDRHAAGTRLLSSR